MGKIYRKAQQEQMREFQRELLNKLERLTSNVPKGKEALKKAIDDIIQAEQQSLAEPLTEERRAPWDFSREKAETVFVRRDNIIIRPVKPDDEEFYCGVRAQYSCICRPVCRMAKENGGSPFMDEAAAPEVFYCIIEKDGTPIGYLGLKDTRLDLWEIAIELDAEHTKQKLGRQSLRLYLNEIYRLTGKRQFQAKVEVDNIPSQKCFERLGAELVGLCDTIVLKTDSEKRQFEERNLDLIDTHIIGLAGRLRVEPRTLLSHILDYRLECPL